jgi:hypothetical protein
MFYVGMLLRICMLKVVICDLMFFNVALRPLGAFGRYSPLVHSVSRPGAKQLSPKKLSDLDPDKVQDLLDLKIRFKHVIKTTREMFVVSERYNCKRLNNNKWQ